MSAEPHQRSAESSIPESRGMHSVDDALLVRADSDLQPELSIVIPTMNEELAIADCIARCKEAVTELGVGCEIIVSDSSTDRTPAIARRAGAIVVTPDEMGYGHAYRYAFEHVRGRYVAIGDADMTYDFTELPSLLGPIVDGEADMVIGNRLTGKMEPGAMPFLHRYLGNPGLTWVLNRLYGVDVSDAHSGFRVMRRECLERLEFSTGGMEFASEMLIKAHVEGLTIEEVPISYGQRKGEATLHTFRDGWRHVRFMLLNAPGHLFSLPGIGLAVAGVTVMVGSYFGLSAGRITPGIGTMVAGSLLTLVGYQVTHLGAYASALGSSIRVPEDPITTWLVHDLTLEHGVLVGGVALLVGWVYASTAATQWVRGGLAEPSSVLLTDIVALTIIVLGVQTVFSACYLSAISEWGDPYE